MARQANIQGLGEALDTLKQMGPEFVKQARKEIREAVKPMQANAKSRVPAGPPLSRWSTTQRQDIPPWNSSSAKRKIGIRIKRQRVRSAGGRVVLVRMIQTDGAGVVLDSAGSRSSGSTLAQNLTNRFGNTSRYMWPAAEANMDHVVDSLEDAQARMADVINRRFGRR